MGPRCQRGGFLKVAGSVAVLLLLGGVVALVVWSRGGFGGPVPEPSPSPELTLTTTPEQRARAEELRKRYPYESLAGRLEYEGDGPAEEATLTPATLKRLDEAETTFRLSQEWSGRAQSLAKLHSDQVEEFIAQPEFGEWRMRPRVSPSYLELPYAPPIPFAALSDLPPGGEGARVELPPTDQGSPLSLATLGSFHDSSRIDFVSPDTLGHVKDRDHVAGFLSHQFRWMPEARDARQPPAPEDRWAVRRLELVSLLLHDRPAVYVSDHLPRMDDLNKSRTRPLSEFEARALEAVRKGEDLVAEATTNRIHLFGSLRAMTQCLDCHHAHRGDLLGAFSYELRRDPAGK